VAKNRKPDSREDAAREQDRDAVISGKVQKDNEEFAENLAKEIIDSVLGPSAILESIRKKEEDDALILKENANVANVLSVIIVFIEKYLKKFYNLSVLHEQSELEPGDVKGKSKAIMQEHVISNIRKFFENVCKTEADKREFLAELGGVLNEFCADILAPDEPADTKFPTQPPALWLERRNRKETPPEFIRREYAPWLGQGLTQAHIRRLDKSLYMALHKWLQSHEPPADLDLPTQKERNDRQLEAAGLPSNPLQVDDRSRESMRLHEMARARLLRANRR
jgi:hypothetical protein